MRGTRMYPQAAPLAATCALLILLAGMHWPQVLAAEEVKPTPAARPTAARGPDERIVIRTDCISAEVWPKGYVSGVKADTFIDLKTGAKDHSFGLDIVDFLMQPGEPTDRGQYEFNNLYHGKIPKRYIELPQICTQAKDIPSDFAIGPDFVAVRQWWTYTQAAAGYKTGSQWQQTLVFPAGRRYFLACDRIRSANDIKDVFLRIDMPGHLRHKAGDVFEEVYLSYEGRIPAEDFRRDFPPDEKHLYQRGKQKLPDRMIRARKYRGEKMPWLAGMTLDPRAVWEAWRHQRGYICFIQEIGGLDVKVGDHFSAAYIVGYFDDVKQMEAEYDRYRGMNSLAATKDVWLMSDGVLVEDGEGYRIVPQGRAAAPEKWRLLVGGKGSATVNAQKIDVDGEKEVAVK